MLSGMDGILLIDKPSGWTSFDVVAKIRGILRSSQSSVISDQSKQTTENRQQKTVPPKVKVGHTGTLDPLATGLMIVVVGSYCKRAEEFSKLDKTYEVTMTLGQTSTTGDNEGEKTVVSDKIPTQNEVDAVLKDFVGEIMQTPPAFSAIKVNGQRAYKLARAGKEVKLEPRKVKVHSIQLTSYSYPEVKFTASVSSGTYIRSLVEDIGQKLGTGAYMSNLRRTIVGPYTVADAQTMEALNPETLKTATISD
jgi:tRNA pseudouridine55 synthase